MSPGLWLWGESPFSFWTAVPFPEFFTLIIHFPLFPFRQDMYISCCSSVYLMALLIKLSTMCSMWKGFSVISVLSVSNSGVIRWRVSFVWRSMVCRINFFKSNRETENSFSLFGEQEMNCRISFPICWERSRTMPSLSCIFSLDQVPMFFNILSSIFRLVHKGFCKSCIKMVCFSSWLWLCRSIRILRIMSIKYSLIKTRSEPGGDSGSGTGSSGGSGTGGSFGDNCRKFLATTWAIAIGEPTPAGEIVAAIATVMVAGVLLYEVVVCAKSNLQKECVKYASLRVGSGYECDACYRECMNNGAWPFYKCPIRSY